MVASGSFSIFIFNNYEISEKKIKYVYTRNVLTSFKKHKIYRRILKILKYSQEKPTVEIVYKKISIIAFLKLR